MLKLIAIASHTTPVNVVKINEDGDLLFSASNDKEDTTVCLFYSHSGERIGSFKCKAAVKSIDVSRDSKFLITMSSIGDLEIWQVEGGIRIGTMVMDKRRSRYVQFLTGDKSFMILSSGFASTDPSELHFYSFPKILAALGYKGQVLTKHNETIIKDDKYVTNKINLEGKYNIAALGPANKYVYVGTDNKKDNENSVSIVDMKGKKLVTKVVHSNPI